MENELAHEGGKVIFKDYIGALKRYHIPFFDRTYVTSIDQQKIAEFDAWRIKQVNARKKSKKKLYCHFIKMARSNRGVATKL